jgi:DNA invertase Pin-like site-specific DNA recombinase
MNILRCISFVSVSSEEQAEVGKTSLADQQAWISAFIRDTMPVRYGVRGVEVEHLQIIGSRKILLLQDAIQTHDAYRRLHDAIQAKEFDVLVAAKMNRVAREEALAITLRDLCLRQGIIPAWGDGLPPTMDITTLRLDEGWRISGMVQAWGAGREVREIGQKVKAGRRGRVEQKGLFSSQANFGYTYIRDENDEKVYVIDSRAAALVRMILVDWFVGEGWGVDKIAQELNVQGIPSVRGKLWYGGVVRDMLRSARVYLGMVVHGGVWMPGTHPAILTADEVAAIERIRSERTRGRPRVYPFSGVVWCGTCNLKMHYHSSEQWTWLRCRLCNIHIREGPIRQALLDMIDYIETADLSSLPLVDTAGLELQHRLTQLDAQIAETHAAMGKLVDAYELGTIPIDLLSSRIDARKRALSSLQLDHAATTQALEQRRRSGTLDDRIAEIRRSAREMLDAPPEVARLWWVEYFRIVIKSRELIEVFPRWVG